MKNMVILSAALLAAVVGVQHSTAAIIDNPTHTVPLTQVGVNLDLANDWFINGTNASASPFATKVGSGITRTGQSGMINTATINHTYLWSNGSGTVDNPDDPLAYNPINYRHANFTGGSQGASPTTLNLGVGGWMAFSIVANDTDVNTVSIYATERRLTEMWLEGAILDPTLTTTYFTLAPTLIDTVSADANSDSVFTFDFQVDNVGDILNFTLLGAGTANGRAIGIDAITVVVPEPSTLGLISLAGGALLLLRRRSIK